MTRKRRLPQIPNVPESISHELRQFLFPVKELLEMNSGLIGNPEEIHGNLISDQLAASAGKSGGSENASGLLFPEWFKLNPSGIYILKIKGEELHALIAKNGINWQNRSCAAGDLIIGQYALNPYSQGLLWNNDESMLYLRGFLESCFVKKNDVLTVDGWIKIQETNNVEGLTIGDLNNSGWWMNAVALRSYLKIGAQLIEAHAFILDPHADGVSWQGQTLSTGDVVIGGYGYSGGKGLYWDQSEAMLHIKGNVKSMSVTGADLPDPEFAEEWDGLVIKKAEEKTGWQMNGNGLFSYVAYSPNLCFGGAPVDLVIYPDGSTSSSPGFEENAFDGDRGTFWNTGDNTNEGEWHVIGYAFAEPFTIRKLVIHDLNWAYTSLNPTMRILFKVSETNAFSGEEVTLIDRTIQTTDWFQDVQFDVNDFTNTISARYYRVYFAGLSTGNHRNIYLSEIKMMEYVQYNTHAFFLSDGIPWGESVFNAGDMIIGGYAYSGGKGIHWDQSQAKLYVKGELGGSVTSLTIEGDDPPDSEFPSDWQGLQVGNLTDHTGFQINAGGLYSFINYAGEVFCAHAFILANGVRWGEYTYDEGDVIIGGYAYASGYGLLWKQSNGTLYVKGEYEGDVTLLKVEGESAPEPDFSEFDNGLVVGKISENTGWQMNARGLFSYISTGDYTYGAHAFSFVADQAWQQSAGGDLGVIDAGFTVDLGDFVLGAYNYYYSQSGDYCGGIFYDQSNRTLHIRGNHDGGFNGTVDKLVVGGDASPNADFSSFSSGLIVGDTENDTGWQMNANGLYSFLTTGGYTYGAHAFCFLENTPWQQDAGGDLSVIDPSFRVNSGDVVLGSYNYYYSASGDPCGGIFYDQSARKLYVRGTIEASSDSGIPVTQDFRSFRTGLQISRKDDDEITVSGGMIEINGGLFINRDNSAFSNDTCPTSYGTNQCSTGGAFNSSNGVTNLYLCFDDDDDTGFFLSGTAGSSINANWIEYDFVTPVKIPKYNFYLNGGHGERAIELRASSTGAFEGEEVVLDSFTTPSAGNLYERDAGDYTVSSAYRYYRLYHDGAFHLQEWRMFDGNYAFPADSDYYVYVKKPFTGNYIYTEHVFLSMDTPAYDGDKGAFYNTSDANQRLIGAFATDGSGNIIENTIKQPKPIEVMGTAAPVFSVIQGNAPSSASDSGSVGDIRFESDYIYVCVAADTWKRAALSSW